LLGTQYAAPAKFGRASGEKAKAVQEHLKGRAS